jgi:carboxylesterase type B
VPGRLSVPLNQRNQDHENDACETKATVEALTIAAVEATAAGTQGATAASRSGASSTPGLSTVLSDASFACTTLQVDKWTSQRAPTFAYEFNDDQAPARFVRLDPPVATHTSELPYPFDLPDTRSRTRSTPTSRNSPLACEPPGLTSPQTPTPPRQQCPGRRSTTTRT